MDDVGEEPSVYRPGINNLPTEILKLLFDRYISSFRYLQTCCLVCRRWLEIIGQSANTMRRFNLIFRNSNLRHISQVEHFQRTYRIVTFSECQFKCIKIQNDINKSKAFDTIEEVAFFNCHFNYKNDLENILCNMKNLKVVLIANREHKSYSKIRKMKIKVDHGGNGQTLQYLHIALHILEVAFENVPRNLKTLDAFISIKDLNAYVYGHEAMLDFIKDNYQEHWTSIITHSGLCRGHDYWLQSINQMPQLRLKRLEINEHIATSIHMKLFATHISTTLTDLVLMSPFDMEEFERMTRLLPNLELVQITLNSENRSWSYQKATQLVVQSFPKLHTLRLGLTYETNESAYEIAWLAQLKRLKRLMLKLQFTHQPCPLKLSSCPNGWLERIVDFASIYLLLTDQVAGELFKRLKNVERLTLRGCEQLTSKGLVGSRITEVNAPVPKTVNDFKQLEFLCLDQHLLCDDLVKEFRIPTLKWLNNGDRLMHVSSDGYRWLSINCPLLMGKHYQVHSELR